MYIDNFPIREDNDLLSMDKQKFFSYACIFRLHKIETIKVNRNTIKTIHTYPDNLEFELEWEISEEFTIQNFELSHVMLILNAIENDYINFKDGKIINYSEIQMDALITLQSHHLMFLISKSFRYPVNNKIKLNDKGYAKKIEYEIENPSVISEEFFNELIDKNKNQILFMKYLEERNIK